MTVTALTPERLNLVEPQAQKASDTRTTMTAGKEPGRIGAVSQMVGESPRSGDVKSSTKRSTRATTRGSRTLTTATRTTPTRTTTTGSASSADSTSSCTFEALVNAYIDCRRTKRNSQTALAFEAHLERNLCDLFEELISGAYRPGRSICFVVTRPKPREIWAAGFRDRVVHHLLYNQVAPRFLASFTADSCACIPGRGTLYAAMRLESQVRSATENWSKPAHYLKCDLANFFVAIDKGILSGLLMPRIDGAWWRALAAMVLFHDPRGDVEVHSTAELMHLVPAHKSLFNAPADTGLPIGNLSSQFFANVYLDALDQFAKHQLRAPRYVRYVDDFVFIHESPQVLNDWLRLVTEFLPSRLGARINPRKTVMQPVARGIDFVGHVIKPWHRIPRANALPNSLRRIRETADDALFETINSYFGLFRQSPSSHHVRARIANAARSRGFSVNGELTKVFRRGFVA